MSRLVFIKSRFEAVESIKLKDGRIISLKTDDGFFLMFDDPFRLDTGEVMPYKEYYRKYARGGLRPRPKMPEGYTDLNALIRDGAKMLHCYEEYDVLVGHPDSLSTGQIDQICEEFKANGFNVTHEAICHNYEAWAAGMSKAAYRDEKNGYHLFTPSCDNPFILRASTLNDLCKDWQITYIC